MKVNVGEREREEREEMNERWRQGEIKRDDARRRKI